MSAMVILWRRLARPLGMVLSFLGALGATMSILTLIDPVGAQMANDADPFAIPPGPAESCLQLAVSLALLGLGLWLFLRRRSPKAAASATSTSFEKTP